MLVRKFGGTSMGSAKILASVVQIVKNSRDKQVVVVSAMSGVTNQLLQLTELALGGKHKAVKKGIVALLEQHIRVVRAMISDPKILTATERYFTKTLTDLTSFLEALAEIGELSAHSEDTIMAVGEQLSSRLLAGVLTASGMSAIQVDLEKVIPKRFQTANHNFYINTEKKFATIFKKVLQQKQIPVATGYFGQVPGGMLRSVGRGYTDFCAALIAAGLKAKKLEIWTDVSGVLTADPRKVKNAQILDKISFEAAAELAHFGARVIHPQSIHPAIRANIPVWIKNTFAPRDRGTEIVREVKRPKRLVSSITSKKGITVVNIASYRMLMQYGFLAKLFEIFARHETSIDVVSTSEVSVSVTVGKTKHLKEIITELKPFSKVSIAYQKAIVCLIGLGMAKQRGVAGEIFTTLGRAGISVDLISIAANEINITFVVDADKADKAVVVLHKKFF